MLPWLEFPLTRKLGFLVAATLVEPLPTALMVMEPSLSAILARSCLSMATLEITASGRGPVVIFAARRYILPFSTTTPRKPSFIHLGLEDCGRIETMRSG